MLFLRFLALAIRRTPIGAFFSAVSSGAGVGMTGIRHLIEMPPWPMAEWWLPIVLVLGGTLGLAWVFYRQVEWMNRAGPWANMTASRAIDYVINYSDADVPSSHPGEIGREHEWARNELLARARAGDIAVWGRRSATLIQHSSKIRSQKSTLIFGRNVSFPLPSMAARYRLFRHRFAGL